MNVNRTTISLIAGVAGLAAVFGVATAAAPAPPAPPKPLPASAERQPVQRTTLMCPAPAGTDYDTSTYADYTPPALYPGGPTGGSAQLTEVPQSDGINTTAKPSAKAKPLVPLKAPGTAAAAPAGHTTYPVTGSAGGALAPGWTAQMTTVIDAGNGAGLLGTACQQAGTDLWIPGASTATDREDFLHLTNPDRQAAAVDVAFYGPKGTLDAPGADNLTIPGNSSVDVLLPVVLKATVRDITAHVSARAGRVAAEIQAMAKPNGADWITPTAQPADSAVLPDIPGDATQVRLIGHATGANDADLKVQLLTPGGAIVPAKNTVELRSGVTTAVDLPKLTQGQIGTLVLTPADPGQTEPFVAALEITRGSGASQDIAFVPATAPVGARATVADNRTSGGSTLGIAAPFGDATVKITSSAPSKGGSPATTTVTVKKGHTLQVSPPKPKGSGTYAVTLVPVSGDPVYAGRELSLPADGRKAFTVQTMPDAGGYVAVPEALRDLTVATG